MVNLKILKKFGCDSGKLREIFTCEDTDNPYHAIRRKFEKRLESRILDGLQKSCKNSDLYMAVDMAWDSAPLNKETVPLLLYAQGKIDLKRCARSLEDLGCAEKFCEKDSKTQEIKTINMPRLYEVSVDLVRSFITRRVAAQASRFANLWPYFKYEPRGSRDVDKFVAELMSQRADIMADQFGYRHYFTQVIRDTFFYGHCVSFPKEAWSEEKQWVAEQVSEEFRSDAGAKPESVVVREGIDFYNPHPTRVFYDISEPLAKVNTDTGPAYIGYWDVVRYGDVEGDAAYWNRDRIEYSGELFALLGKYPLFFDYYLDPCLVKAQPDTQSLASGNDRKSNVGAYSGTDEDKALFLTQYFERVNPADEGIGEYPHDVWMRLVVASDNTVVYGEFLPSLPAVYCGLNENDNRLVNISQAHELLPYQDQITNILSQMLKDLKSGLTQIWLLNKDVLDKQTQDYITEAMKGDKLYAHPHALLFSGSQMKDLNLDIDKVLKVVQAEMAMKVNEAFAAIMQILGIVERLMILSPHELGQPAPREITASEVTVISNTTNSIYAFISDGVDEARTAVKKMIFESLVGASEHLLDLPIARRFPESVIEKAKFSLTDGGHIRGAVENLVVSYNFNSRDGAERSVDTQAAQTLMQMAAQLFQIPGLAQEIGKERLFGILNEIFRLSGANHDLNLEVGEDESNDIPGGEGGPAPAEGGEGEMEQALLQMAQAMQGMDERLMNLEGGMRGQPAQPPMPPPGVG